MLGHDAAQLLRRHPHRGHTRRIEAHARVRQHRRAAREAGATDHRRRAARPRPAARRHVVKAHVRLVLEQHLVGAEVLSVQAQLEREQAGLRLRRRQHLQHRRAQHVRTHQRLHAHAHHERHRWTEAAPKHAHQRAASQHANRRLHAAHHQRNVIRERHGRLQDGVVVDHVDGHGTSAPSRRRDAPHRALAVEARPHHVQTAKAAPSAVLAAARSVVQASATHDDRRASKQRPRARLDAVGGHVLVLKAQRARRVLLVILRHAHAHHACTLCWGFADDRFLSGHACIHNLIPKPAARISELHRPCAEALGPYRHSHASLCCGTLRDNIEQRSVLHRL